MQVKAETEGAPQPNPPGPPRVQTGGVSSPISKVVLAVIIVFVVLMAAYLILGGGSTGQLQSVIGQESLNSTKLAQVVMQKLNSTQQLNVSYSGQVVFRSSGGMLGSAQFTIPITIVYSKYGSNSRTNISASDIPILGGINAALFTINGSRYTCLSHSGGSFLGGAGASNATGGVQCTESVGTGGSALNMNISNITKGSHAKLNLVGTFQATVAGAPCTEGIWNYTASTNVSTASQAGGILPQVSSATGRLAVCFSNTYYLPLLINLTSSSANFTLSMAISATNVGTQVSAAYVDTLPASPTVSTGNGYSTTVPYQYTTTASQSSLNMSQSTQGSNCSGFILNNTGASTWDNSTCAWTGGNVTVYTAGGDSGAARTIIKGLSDGKVYFTNRTNARCAQQAGSVYLPAQTYGVSIKSGAGGGYCGAAEVDITPG